MQRCRLTYDPCSTAVCFGGKQSDVPKARQRGTTFRLHQRPMCCKVAVRSTFCTAPDLRMCCETQAQCNASAPFAENAYVAAYNFGNTTRDQFSLTYWCAPELGCCMHSMSYPLIATWCHGRHDNTIQPADVHAQ